MDPDAKRPGPAPLLVEARPARGVARGARNRGPRCGERDLWVTWFRCKPRCPICDLRFEQEEGGYLGAMVINYSVAFAFWIVMMAIAMALTVPFIPVMPLIGASVVVLGGVPLWFYPRSKMLWAAVEFLTARSEPGYHTPTARDPRAESVE